MSHGSWMTISDDSNFNMNENVLHQQVESFIHTATDFDGIQVADGRHVDPVIFLNILQATLKANVSEDLEFLDELPDPYFSVEDYELAAEEEEDGDEDTMTIKDVMYAMDQQLVREHNDDIATNWRQSLEENAGGTGPVQTILRGLP